MEIVDQLNNVVQDLMCPSGCGDSLSVVCADTPDDGGNLGVKFVCARCKWELSTTVRARSSSAESEQAAMDSGSCRPDSMSDGETCSAHPVCEFTHRLRYHRRVHLRLLFYLLLRDHIPVGVLNWAMSVVEDVREKKIGFSNSLLKAMADSVCQRLSESAAWASQVNPKRMDNYKATP
jgi:hypothetical protein